ncbi:hypothetical protein DV736_g6167, partial [Chaetothyriales sp. CBS 134916]
MTQPKSAGATNSGPARSSISGPRSSTSPNSTHAADAGAPLGPNDILKFANGQLDLVEGYKYNEEKIMAFMHDMAENCAKFLGTSLDNTTTTDLKLVAKAIQNFILTSNNTTAKLVLGKDFTEIPNSTRGEVTPGIVPGTNPPHRAAAEKMEKASIALSRAPKPIDPRPSSLEIKTLPFGGSVSLPMGTIFDYLAWVLSILGSADKADSGRSASNYYLPVLALFSRWCTVISALIKSDALPMVHISWWDTKVLFGATLGAFVAKETKAALISARQGVLTDNGYHQPPKGVSSRGDGQNFGACAETNLFIVAKLLKLDPKSVRGIAMVPEAVDNLPINQLITKLKSEKPTEAGILPLVESDVGEGPFEPGLRGEAKIWSDTYEDLSQYQSAVLRLADPCEQSCQILFTEDLKWDWRLGFDVAALKQAHGMGNWELNPKGNPETIGLAGAGTGKDAWKPTRIEADQLKKKQQAQQAIGHTVGTVLQPVAGALYQAGSQAIASSLLGAGMA